MGYPNYRLILGQIIGIVISFFVLQPWLHFRQLDPSKPPNSVLNTIKSSPNNLEFSTTKKKMAALKNVQKKKERKCVLSASSPFPTMYFTRSMTNTNIWVKFYLPSGIDFNLDKSNILPPGKTRYKGQIKYCLLTLSQSSPGFYVSAA